MLAEWPGPPSHLCFYLCLSPSFQRRFGPKRQAWPQHGQMEVKVCFDGTLGCSWNSVFDTFFTTEVHSTKLCSDPSTATGSCTRARPCASPQRRTPRIRGWGPEHLGGVVGCGQPARAPGQRPSPRLGERPPVPLPRAGGAPVVGRGHQPALRGPRPPPQLAPGDGTFARLLLASKPWLACSLLSRRGIGCVCVCCTMLLVLCGCKSGRLANHVRHDRPGACRW